VRGLIVFGAGTVLAHRAEVTAEVFDDGAVLWDSGGDRLHQLDPVGSAVWGLVDGHRTLGEISATLAAAYGTDEMTVRRDLTGFLQDMVHSEVLAVVA
jgi:hypothetical protein